MREQITSSFAEIKENGSLRWEVQGANWKFVGSLLDLEEKMRDANRELAELRNEIGAAVIEGEQPDPARISKARQLEEDIDRLRLQMTQVHDQMRAAMREKLRSMLVPTEAEQVSNNELGTLFDDLEHTSRTQLSLSRMLDRGMQQLREREENS